MARNERCSDPPAHGRAGLEARPPAPPLTQLQLDRIRATIRPLVEYMRKIGYDNPRDIEMGMWWLYHEISFWPVEPVVPEDLR